MQACPCAAKKLLHRRENSENNCPSWQLRIKKNAEERKDPYHCFTHLLPIRDSPEQTTPGPRGTTPGSGPRECHHPPQARSAASLSRRRQEYSPQSTKPLNYVLINVQNPSHWLITRLARCVSSRAFSSSSSPTTHARVCARITPHSVAHRHAYHAACALHRHLLARAPRPRSPQRCALLAPAPSLFYVVVASRFLPRWGFSSCSGFCVSGLPLRWGFALLRCHGVPQDQGR